MSLKRTDYADAWPWTLTTIGARIMFLTAIAVAVYVTFVLFGNFAETVSTHGLSDAVVRWIIPVVEGGAVIFAAGFVLYVWGRLRTRGGNEP